MARKAQISRKTKETDIVLELGIDGTGASDIVTGNGFMDHMLILFSRHGLFDLKLACKGDTYIDSTTVPKISESVWVRLSRRRWEIAKE